MVSKGVWQWHQSSGTRINEDMMLEPGALNVAIFLDEVNPFNGLLMFILVSHNSGVLKVGYDLTTKRHPLWTIYNQLISQIVGNFVGREH